MRKSDAKTTTGRAQRFSGDCLKKETCLMVIECIGCLIRFNLNENLLKPTGSLVRCSKCGNIFPAFPTHKENSMNSALGTDEITKDGDQSEIATPGIEKRMHFRVPISIPAICDVLDLEGNPCDIHVGTIKDISQAGISIDLFTSPISEQLSLSFTNDENNDVQIKAKVVHSRTQSLMTRIGLSLTGPQMEIDNFVSQAMKTHQISCSSDQQIQV
jgi:predicted Zn finger-like uncharacterized protein